MTQTLRMTLFIVGGLWMALPGLFTAEWSFYSIAFMGGGCLFLVTACVKNGFTAPRTALLLLLISNTSFWLSYALWSLRPKLVGPPSSEGIDPFAGAEAFWLVLFLIFLIYETSVFVVGVTANRQRSFATAGLVAVVAQVLVTLRTIYTSIMGV